MAARQPVHKTRLAIACLTDPDQTSGPERHEKGKRNGDGGIPQFIGASIMNLVRASLETHP